MATAAQLPRIKQQKAINCLCAYCGEEFVSKGHSPFCNNRCGKKWTKRKESPTVMSLLRTLQEWQPRWLRFGSINERLFGQLLTHDQPLVNVKIQNNSLYFTLTDAGNSVLRGEMPKARKHILENQNHE